MIPTDIVSWFRTVFAASNRRLSERIQNAPATPESHLDTTFIEHLYAYSTPRSFPSGWAIRIDTHYLGGLRHFRGWEIADIGVFVFFRHAGLLIRQKVALLQSKRLYPTAGDIDYLDAYDFRVGIARLAQREKHAPSMLAQRLLTFDDSSAYPALHAHDRQYNAIREYMGKYKLPVFYLLYNPPTTPLHVQVPITGYSEIIDGPPLGSRIFPYNHVSRILDTRPERYTPRLSDIADGGDSHTSGWRLEYFMADLLLSCHTGRRFTEADSDAMDTLFFRRSGPIAATVAVTVEMPEQAELPQ